ncbi:hypothetical protein QYE76_037834 [Lolium multiflorum]|uniref:Uncharacterized protein n=1 Tax=Lolium multiflorum TaxID=4521 RepID=A0AAD8T6T8_LOLMU|nr:hypothetical protein QYE76_037834 [Lolium multiflorum]
MAEGPPVTYEDLTEELKKKYDDVKAIFEADLIGSFQRTRSHGIRWKGFSPDGALDGIDLSAPSEERTRSLRQEINYMVAHSLHRHSENLVNTLERVALRVIREIMSTGTLTIGPALGAYRGRCPQSASVPFALAAPPSTLVQDTDFDQVQFICEALCFLKGANNESFLSCNEPIATVLSEDSFGVQGGLLLVKPLVFRLQYRLSTEEEAIDGVKSDWFGMVAVSELPGFKALSLICASSPIFSP